MRIICFFLVVLMLCMAFLATACDTGMVCDAQGSCEPAAQEDRATLKPNITQEIEMAKVGAERP